MFALTAWAPFARLALAQTRVLRDAAFVEAAVALGRAHGDRLRLGELVDLPLAAVREAFEGNLTRALGDS